MTAGPVDDDAGDVTPPSRFPVLVTAKQTHVVWVEADSHAAAVRAVNAGDDPRTPTSLALRVISVYAPRNASDWNLVEQPGETYPGTAGGVDVPAAAAETPAGAREACAAAGHPGAVQDPIDAGAFYCPTCCRLVPTEPVSVPTNTDGASE